MDFDPKCFFENPPRMKEDLKEYIKDLSRSIVKKFVLYANILFPGEKLSAKHVQLLVISVCPDPLTSYNKNGLCIQNIKLKHIHRILCKSIQTSIACEDKYGNNDKKIFKFCKSMCLNVKISTSGIIAMTAIVSEICGIILQSAKENSVNPKTLTLEMVKSEGMTHISSSGTRVPYGSIVRFLNIVTKFEPVYTSQPEKKKLKTNQKDKTNEKEKTNQIDKSVRFYEQKQKILTDIRPQTPDICFWED